MLCRMCYFGEPKFEIITNEETYILCSDCYDQAKKERAKNGKEIIEL